jgi:hypothetical protein
VGLYLRSSNIYNRRITAEKRCIYSMYPHLPLRYIVPQLLGSYLPTGAGRVLPMLL